jgi:phage terminase large subunit-like protein
MKSIDKEIFEVENRLHLREARIKQAARDTRARAVKALKSPAAVGGAVALGFVVAGFLGRRKGRVEAPAVSQQTKEEAKGFAVAGLLMTAATWFIKSQFGGPVGLAHFVISKIKNRNQPPPVYQ